MITDFYPAYSSIKVYREASNDKALQFWQKYWAVRSIYLIIDYLLWPFVENIDAMYILKIGMCFSLSYFKLAEIIYDRIVFIIYIEIEPYADILMEHATVTKYFALWKGNLYSFFIEELEEFLVPS